MGEREVDHRCTTVLPVLGVLVDLRERAVIGDGVGARGDGVLFSLFELEPDLDLWPGEWDAGRELARECSVVLSELGVLLDLREGNGDGVGGVGGLFSLSSSPSSSSSSRSSRSSSCSSSSSLCAVDLAAACLARLAALASRIIRSGVLLSGVIRSPLCWQCCRVRPATVVFARGSGRDPGAVGAA